MLCTLPRFCRITLALLFLTGVVLAGRKLVFSISPDDSYGCIEIQKGSDTPVTTCTSNYTFSTNYSATHTLTALPADGREFDHWEGYAVDGSTANPVTFKMLGSTEYITAVFTDGGSCTAPVITSPPADQTVCEGAAATFSVNAAGGRAPRFSVADRVRDHLAGPHR